MDDFWLLKAELMRGLWDAFNPTPTYIFFLFFKINEHYLKKIDIEN